MSLQKRLCRQLLFRRGHRVPSLVRRLASFLILVPAAAIPAPLASQTTELCEQERMRYAQQCADYQPLTSADWERCTSMASAVAPSSMQEINAEGRCRAVLRVEFRRENPHLFTPEVTQPTPSNDAVRPPPTSRRRSCCRICRTGKACGNSCISRSYTCRRPPGCACNGNQLQLGPGAAAACDIGLPSPLLPFLTRDQFSLDNRSVFPLAWVARIGPDPQPVEGAGDGVRDVAAAVVRHHAAHGTPKTRS